MSNIRPSHLHGSVSGVAVLNFLIFQYTVVAGRFVSKIMKLCLNLLKLCLQYCTVFFQNTVYNFCITVCCHTRHSSNSLTWILLLELLKSVHICQSYRKNKSGTFLWPTVVHKVSAPLSTDDAKWLGTHQRSFERYSLLFHIGVRNATQNFSRYYLRNG